MDIYSNRLALTALDAVRSPRAIHKLAWTLGSFIVLLIPVLLFVPWVQNVAANGRVIALDPLDRIQIIPAPVTGVLEEVFVQEGSFVEAGELLARMRDQDPFFKERLEDQVRIAELKVDAADKMVKSYDFQRESLQMAREEAISSAQFSYQVAKDNLAALEEDLRGYEAKLQQKEADFNRQRNLLEGGAASEDAFQQAERDYREAEANLKSAQKRVEQAKSQVNAKQADIGKVRNDEQAKLDKLEAEQQEAVSKQQLAEKELLEAKSRAQRQDTQEVVAKRTGTILRIHAANSADLITQGTALIELIPQTDELAVELWVRGVDAPLVSPGRKARLQFEGWPAVQFAGWPSVAVGTFGGVVRFIDAHGNQDGMFRVLIEPDPEAEPWPSELYVRQGIRANGFMLLNEVSLAYEVWRNLNAFPPTVQAPNSNSSVDGGSLPKGKPSDAKEAK
jgi:multidrug resistance efflux pump